MKKILLMLACSAVAMCGAAANYLHVKTDKGWEVLDLDRVDRLTFSGGKMTASDEQGATVATFNQTALEQIYVDETTGVTSVEAQEAKATFTYNTSAKTALMLADGNFEISAADGACLVSVPAKSGEYICLEAINPGVVILKSGKYTLKAIVK